MKKISKFIIGLFCPLYLLLDKYGFSNWLEKNYPNHSELIYWGLFGIIVIATIINYFLSIYNPEKKYENAVRSRVAFLKAHFQKNIDAFKDCECEVTFNVMKEINFRGYKKLYPKEKRWWKNFFPKIYDCDFSVPDDYKIPLEFTLGARQGVNNLCKLENGLKMYGIRNKSKETVCSDLNLTDKQYEYVKKSTFIASMPIMPKDISTGKVKYIGILSMVSNTDGMEKADPSFDLTDEGEVSQKFYKDMRNLIEISMAQHVEVYGLLNF